MQVFDDPAAVTKYYSQLGEHFASNQEYATAERLYVKAGMYKEAINMYNQAGKYNLFLICRISYNRVVVCFLPIIESVFLHLLQ